MATVKTEAPAYAKAAGNSYSLHLPLARLSSTLPGVNDFLPLFAFTPRRLAIYVHLLRVRRTCSRFSSLPFGGTNLGSNPAAGRLGAEGSKVRERDSGRGNLSLAVCYRSSTRY